MRTLGVLVLALLTGACAARGAVPRPFPGAPLPPGRPLPTPTIEGDQPSDVGDRTQPSGGIHVVDAALSLRGTPYRTGGSDPSGFDCSGFVQYVFARLGLWLPREVRDQFGVGKKIEFGDVRAGDLVFFETVARGASHVGLAVGADQFVHAPSSTGVVRVERLTAPYWARRFIGARRIQ